MVFLAVVLLLGIVLTFVPRLHNVPHNPLEAMVQTPPRRHHLHHRRHDRRRRARGSAARVHRAPVRPVPRRRARWAWRPTASPSASATSNRAGTRCSRRDSSASSGAPLRRPPEHRRADGQPRRVQPAAAHQVRLAAVTSNGSVLTPCRLFALSRREFAALVAIFALSLPAVTARIYSSDEVEYFSYLRSLWFDHDVSFENEYQYFYDRDVARAEGFHETFLEHRDGSRTTSELRHDRLRDAVGPFYAVGDLTARTLRRRLRRGGRWLLAAVHRRRRVRVGGLRVSGRPALDRGGPTGPAGCAGLGGVQGRVTPWRGRRGRGPCVRREFEGRAPHLDRNTAALLHVRRAAVVARLLGVRRRALRHRLAPRAGGRGRRDR